MIEKLLEEIQYQVPLKDTTEAGDTVIFLRETENGQVSVTYAHVLGFDHDLSKRDEWWHVHFIFFEIPPQARTIILQTPHFTGQNIFTMGGRKVFIKAVNFEAFRVESAEPAAPGGRPRKQGDRQARAKNAPSGKPTFTLIK
ncbi:hypothetical protein FACS189460_5660 [Deltaproteobacteria bacterium]|nr:hypothetical protein FACS189460_5660 [Deltaproteobacteria bacterium]